MARNVRLPHVSPSPLDPGDTAAAARAKERFEYFAEASPRSRGTVVAAIVGTPQCFDSYLKNVTRPQLGFTVGWSVIADSVFGWLTGHKKLITVQKRGRGENTIARRREAAKALNVRRSCALHSAWARDARSVSLSQPARPPHDPFLLKGMRAASTASKRRSLTKKNLIWGD